MARPLAPGVIIGCGCEPATGALEDQRDEVACHEDNCVDARAAAGDILVVDDNDAGEAEVKGAGEESGSDCKNYEIATKAVRAFPLEFEREICMKGEGVPLT